MHIPDGFCSLTVCAGTGALALGALGLSWHHARTGAARKLPAALPATAAAVIFSAQMLNFPVAAGTSGHFLGAVAAAAVFGPYRACLLMFSVLAVQALLFADGGITAFGANLLNMGVIGGFGGYFLLRVLTRLLPRGRAGFLSATGIAAWFSVVLASMACSVELALSGTLPFALTLPAMAGTHALIGLGEGLISVALVGTLAAARPDLLPEWSGATPTPALADAQPLTNKRVWPVILGGAGLALLLAAAVSPFASSAPDGLERVAEDAGILERATMLWTLSPLPDYTLGALSNSVLSTAAAGVLGVLATLAACYLLAPRSRKCIPA